MFGVYFNNFPSETVNKRTLSFLVLMFVRLFCTLRIVVRAVHTFCTDSYSG